MRRVAFSFSFLWLLLYCPAFCGAESLAALPESAAVPAAVKSAAATLPPEARPVELRAANNGALYALLPNGCEIVIKEKRNAPVATVQAWVRTGAADEGKWLGAGLSHFCEHLLFKGTTQRPAGMLDQLIRGAGGDNNAYTTSERTVFHITSAAEGFKVSFEVLADLVMDATFPPEETLKEHAVVTKEIERNNDSPDGVFWDAFERTIYQTHPYRVPVLGYPDRFARVTRDEVFAYYQGRYAPQMCTFIAVGDFAAAAVLPQMARTLAPWKRKDVLPAAVPDEPEQLAPRETRLVHPLCEVPRMTLAFPTVSLRHPDLYALDLLASILGDGRSSRLYQALKDKQDLVLEISASHYTPQYPGYLAVFATAEPAKLENARAAILKSLEEALTKRPGDDELARAKRKIYTQHVFRQMTADGVAEDLGNDWQVAGDLDFSARYAERMQQVTRDEVLRVARKYLLPEKLNTVILLPEAKAGMTPAPAPAPAREARLAALQDELKALQADALVAKASLLPEQGVFEFALKPSGLRVVVCEDHSLPDLNVSLAALGGTRWEPAELAGAGNLLAEMLDRGTASRSKLKITEESEGLGASLSTFPGHNSFGVNVSGLKQDAAKLLDLAADCMLRPAFPADELEKLKADVIQQIAQEDESLLTLNGKVLRPLLFGAHPYSRQILGTPETVAKVSAADLRKLHQAWVRPENIAVGLVGDVTALQALELVRASLGGLKPGALKAPSVPPMPELAEAKEGQGEKPNITGAILTLAFRVPGLKSPDRETLDLMAGLLSGSGGRLYTALREKQGLAYDVGAYDDCQLDGGALVFYIQTDAPALDKALKGMWEEVRKLRAEPPPRDELDRAKSFLCGTEAIELQHQGELAQRLALAQLYEEGAARIYERKARLEKITAEDVKAAAVKYLDEKKWAKAVLKPSQVKGEK